MRLIRTLLPVVIALFGAGCSNSQEPAKPMQAKKAPGVSSFMDAIAADLSARKITDSLIDGLPAVKIGNQTWATYNLDTDHFRNGDKIMQFQSVEEFAKACDEGIPAWCYIQPSVVRKGLFGKMYNLAAVMDPRGLAPGGWKVPSSFDWQTLNAFLGNGGAAKLKSKMGWTTEAGNPDNGTDNFGFSAYPGGVRMGPGMEGAPFQLTGFWTSTAASGEYQYVVQFLQGWNLDPSPMNKKGGYYIRLVHE